jgi:hypothetical protein
MTNYASKELIERAVGLNKKLISDRGDGYRLLRDRYRYLEACSLLARDLAKATPLPTDAEHAAAIEEWLKKAKRYPSSYQTGWFITEALVNAICDLARRAPRPEPKPESRASSALLAAANNVVTLFSPNTGHRDESTWRETAIGQLQTAIEAEEARGPSEDIGKTIDDNSDAMHMLAKNDEIERLRKERDEAIARAERAEAALDDDPLREWLSCYTPGDSMNTTVEQDQAALAELCRRALARGAK